MLTLLFWVIFCVLFVVISCFISLSFHQAEEVHENNSWLTYGEPMHRLREFGIPIKLVSVCFIVLFVCIDMHRLREFGIPIKLVSVLYECVF